MRTRAFTRVKLNAGVTVRFSDGSMSGVAENICLQGFYLRMSDMAVPAESVNISLFPPSSKPVHASVSVVRHDHAGGIGVRIKSIDVHSFVNLRNLIAQECNDFNRIMSETYRMADCIQ